ncbi:MAG: hypothetical protein ACD_20C00169G0013 [uncultured bacterium]|nr:MAG: hypothetical protein ACD_20C00169G0013 [uncultured bacterium]
MYAKDYNDSTQQYNLISVPGDLAWDTGDWDMENWTSNKAVKKNLRINGSCESLQIGVRNLEANQPFTVLGFSFDVEVANL